MIKKNEQHYLVWLVLGNRGSNGAVLMSAGDLIISGILTANNSACSLHNTLLLHRLIIQTNTTNLKIIIRH